MSDQVVLIHSALKRDITVTTAQSKAILVRQEQAADKRKAAGTKAVAGEWSVKKAGDA